MLRSAKSPTGRAARGLFVFAVSLACLACGKLGDRDESSDRAIHVERGPQGTEIEFNPGVARRNADQAGHELQRSADEAGRSLERGAREVGEKVGPAARELGQELQKGARDLQEKAGPAAQQAGDALKRGARQVNDAVGPAVRRAAADTALTAKVQAKLLADPEIHAAKIGVSTTDGVVTLSGRVPTLDEKRAAERVARATDGVQRVVDALEVGPEPPSN
jgi:osmotically-inducible protein OsmY